LPGFPHHSGGKNHLSSIGIRVRCFAAFRASIATLTIVVAAIPALSRAEDAAPRPAATPATVAAPSNIVIGFVGGFVAHDNPHHGPVQLAQRIQRTVPKDTYVRVFENRRRKQAYDAILRLLDTDHDGSLSAEEKAHARIILFGHSWGGAAAVLLARELRREGVRVLLTVQVDSIAKMWQNDAVIPDNVAAAVNFYQPHGILHGRPQITAADPAKTQVLGNYREDYHKNPIECTEASWFSRVFTSGHMQSECDPHVWSQIEIMVRQRLSASADSPRASAAVPVAVPSQR
jgi:pimeloyl-ACP methyl ester carboxylesterase